MCSKWIRVARTYHHDHNCAVAERKEESARYRKSSMVDERSRCIINRAESGNQFASVMVVSNPRQIETRCDIQKYEIVCRKTLCGLRQGLHAAQRHAWLQTASSSLPCLKPIVCRKSNGQGASAKLIAELDYICQCTQARIASPRIACEREAAITQQMTFAATSREIRRSDRPKRVSENGIKNLSASRAAGDIPTTV